MAKTIAGLLVVFLAGIVFGAGLMHLHGRHMRHKMFKDKDFHEKMHKRIMSKMQKRLDLDPEQFEKINTIMLNMHNQIQAFHEQHFPKMKKLFDTHFEQVKNVLTPEQAQKFEKLIHSKREGMLGFPPPPPPMHPRPKVMADKKA